MGQCSSVSKREGRGRMASKASLIFVSERIIFFSIPGEDRIQLSSRERIKIQVSF